MHLALLCLIFPAFWAILSPSQGWAIGLHALWNVGYIPGMIISGFLSVREFRRLLANRGYRN